MTRSAKWARTALSGTCRAFFGAYRGFAKQSLCARLWPFGRERGRVRSSPISAKRGDRIAYPTAQDGTGSGSFCATFLKARLAACSGAARGGDPRPGQKDRRFRPARDGFGPGEALPPLPPGAQSCQLVESGGGSRPFGLARGGIRARRISLGRGHRRNVGETLREEDLGQGRLPRSGALHPWAFRQEQRAAVGLRDVVGGDPLGFEGMGSALP